MIVGNYSSAAATLTWTAGCAASYCGLSNATCGTVVPQYGNRSMPAALFLMGPGEQTAVDAPPVSPNGDTAVPLVGAAAVVATVGGAVLIAAAVGIILREFGLDSNVL
jgi:hypothetical protein